MQYTTIHIGGRTLKLFFLTKLNIVLFNKFNIGLKNTGQKILKIATKYLIRNILSWKKVVMLVSVKKKKSI